MKINIETIPHESQRYETCGDYWIEEDGTIQVRVSESLPEYEWLIIVHELVELALVQKRGISIDAIDKFDKDFEALREANPGVVGDQEPGNMVSAPYHNEHQFATIVETNFAQQMGVNWSEYDEAINNLGKKTNE